MPSGRHRSSSFRSTRSRRSRSRNRNYQHRRYSRSRSKSRSRSRSRSKSRSRSRQRNQSRSRSDSRGHLYRNPRSPSRSKAEEHNPKTLTNDEIQSLSHLSEEEQMKIIIGFSDFDSSKGKPVEENQKGPANGTVRKDSKRQYRQYMNRRGGFNRPLDQA